MTAFELIHWGGRTYVSNELTDGVNQVVLDIARDFQCTGAGMSATEQRWQFQTVGNGQVSASCYSGGLHIFSDIYARDTRACFGHVTGLYVFRGARLYFVLPEEVTALKRTHLWLDDDATQWIGR